MSSSVYYSYYILGYIPNLFNQSGDIMISSVNNICKETSIPYPLYKSMAGKYFIGQTEFLPINSNSLLVALVNPSHSNVNIFLNVATITSLKTIGLVEFYLGSNLCQGICSNLVKCTNTNFDNCPKGLIKYLEPAIIPNNATSIFTRYITNPGTEIIDGGQIILAPGKSFYVYMSDSNYPLTNLSTRVAFGWWEDNKVCCNSMY